VLVAFYFLPLKFLIIPMYVSNDFHLLTEPVIEKTLRASVAEVSVLLLFSDEMDADTSNVPVSALDDIRNSEMFSSCLSSQHFEKLIVSPATASSLNMHHLDARCQKIHLDLQVFIFCLVVQ
jgi:autophagy-related protein 2